MRVYTLPELVERTVALPKALEHALVRAYRTSQPVGHEASIDELTQRGLGRRLWSEDPKGAHARVKETPVRAHGSVITGGLEARGLAAMVELGGRTKEHPISAKAGGLLAFEGSSLRGGDVLGLRPGARVFVPSVTHPGAQVPARPFLRSGLRATLDTFGPEAEGELQQTCDQVVG